MIRILASLAASVLLAAAARAEGELRHIVCFKFNDEATPEKVAMVEQAFAELPKKIDTIQGLEWGTNVSKEGKDKGFTHCFVLTFKSQEDLDAYLPHPAHREFGSKLAGLVADVFVIDFVAK